MTKIILTTCVLAATAGLVQIAAGHEVQAEVDVQRDAAERQRDTVAFVGVATTASRPGDVGLLVRAVEPGSPAEAAGLGVGDVIERLDDQLLVNSEQFATLVRLREPGTEAALTLAGADEPVKVTLGEVDRPEAFGVEDALGDLGGFGGVVPPELRGLMLRDLGEGGGMELMLPGEGRLVLPGADLRLMREQVERARQDIEQMRGQLMQEGLRLRGDLDGVDPAEFFRQFGDLREVPIQPAAPELEADRPARDFGGLRRNVTLGDDRTTSRFVQDADGKRFTYTVDGEAVFDGPVDTKAQRDALPDEVREALEKIDPTPTRSKKAV